MSKNQTPTIFLSGLFFASMLGMMIGWQLLVELFSIKPSAIVDLAVTAISFFIGGLGGVVFILRKEFVQKITIRGRLAIVYGLVFTSIMWGTSLYALIRMVKLMMNNEFN